MPGADGFQVLTKGGALTVASVLPSFTNATEVTSPSSSSALASNCTGSPKVTTRPLAGRVSCTSGAAFSSGFVAGTPRDRIKVKLVKTATSYTLPPRVPRNSVANGTGRVRKFVHDPSKK